VPLFTSDGLDLGLVTLVLVLRIWSCLQHWTEAHVRKRFAQGKSVVDNHSLTNVSESGWCSVSNTFPLS